MSERQSSHFQGGEGAPVCLTQENYSRRGVVSDYRLGKFLFNSDTNNLVFLHHFGTSKTQRAADGYAQVSTRAVAFLVVAL